jgi:hypothetical protein
MITLVKFSFPRTGSHFLTHILSGLYDAEDAALALASGAAAGAGANAVPVAASPVTAAVETVGSAVETVAVAPWVNEEVLTRDNELNPAALYALSLRERDGWQAPLLIETGRTGMHGKPGDLREGEFAVVLIRDPLATVFSYYRVLRDRWEPGVAFDADSVRVNLEAYGEFYDAGWALKQQRPSNVALLRYERLVASPEETRYLVNFLNYRPKLEPEFVWEVTRFQNMVTPGERTFYREANNEAWKRDAYFVECVKGAGDFDFTRFGYGNRESYLAGM